MTFDQIVGQDHIKEALVTAMEKGKVSHAYLFTGPEGIGKRSLARAFAGILLCRDGKSGMPCGVCRPCVTLAQGTCPDYREINPSRQESIGIDEVRELQADIIVRPLYSMRKVYLIADGDRMTPQAQNCLLKVLEEPPSYAVIIITSSNPEALLETVRSRVLRYGLKRNTEEELRSFLEKRLGKARGDIDFIASCADGLTGKALALAESSKLHSLRDMVFDLLARLPRADVKEMLDIQSFFEDSKGDISTVLDIMSLFYRDVLVVKNASGAKRLINADKKDIILGAATFLSTSKLIDNIETIERARQQLKANAGYQLVVDLMLMKIREE